MFIKLHRDLRLICIYLSDYSNIAIEYTGTSVNDCIIFSLYLPFDLIVISILHNLIAFAKHDITIKFFLYAIRWIKVILKYPVQSLYAKAALSHRCQYLHIIWID